MAVLKNCLSCKHYKDDSCGSAVRNRFRLKTEFNRYLKEDSSECKDYE